MAQDDTSCDSAEKDDGSLVSKPQEPESNSGNDIASFVDDRVTRIVSQEVHKLEERMVVTLQHIKSSLDVLLQETGDSLQKDTQSVAGRLQQSFVIDVQKLVRRIETERDERTHALTQMRKDVDMQCALIKAEVSDLKREVGGLEQQIAECTYADSHVDERAETFSNPVDTDGSNTLEAYKLDIVGLQSNMNQSQKHIEMIESKLSDMRRDINKQVELLHQHGVTTQSIFSNVQREIRALLVEHAGSGEQAPPPPTRSPSRASTSGEGVEVTGTQLRRCMNEIRCKLDEMGGAQTVTAMPAKQDRLAPALCRRSGSPLCARSNQSGCEDARADGRLVVEGMCQTPPLSGSGPVRQASPWTLTPVRVVTPLTPLTPLPVGPERKVTPVGSPLQNTRTPPYSPMQVTPPITTRSLHTSV